MSLERRIVALLACAFVTGGAAAAPDEPQVKRLGKTVVQYQDPQVKAVLSWKYANQTFEKGAWLLLEVGFAAEAKTVNLDREDVALLTPGGERLGLPGQKRLAEGLKDVRWELQKASVAREPVADYFHRPTRAQRLPFFAVPGAQTVLEEIGGGPSVLTIGDLWFESPTGTWKPGRYTLVMKNKTMSVELPFTLPADEPGKDAKRPDAKTVPW